MTDQDNPTRPGGPQILFTDIDDRGILATVVADRSDEYQIVWGAVESEPARGGMRIPAVVAHDPSPWSNAAGQVVAAGTQEGVVPIDPGVIAWVRANAPGDSSLPSAVHYVVDLGNGRHFAADDLQLVEARLANPKPALSFERMGGTSFLIRVEFAQQYFLNLTEVVSRLALEIQKPVPHTSEWATAESVDIVAPVWRHRVDDLDPGSYRFAVTIMKPTTGETIFGELARVEVEVEDSERALVLNERPTQGQLRRLSESAEPIMRHARQLMDDGRWAHDPGLEAEIESALASLSFETRRPVGEPDYLLIEKFELRLSERLAELESDDGGIVDHVLEEAIEPLVETATQEGDPATALMVFDRMAAMTKWLDVPAPRSIDADYWDQIAAAADEDRVWTLSWLTGWGEEPPAVKRLIADHPLSISGAVGTAALAGQTTGSAAVVIKSSLLAGAAAAIGATVLVGVIAVLLAVLGYKYREQRDQLNEGDQVAEDPNRE